MNIVAPVLISWYKVNQRDLPWRYTKDPYKIWLSEVILQQTQIQTGLHYYTRILQRYPDVESLAKADKNEFMKLWQGLGYYRRAENLLKAVQCVFKHQNGKVPCTYQSLLKLPGVGEYTAAAIASFAYKLPVPVVDGNVRRVISRLFDVSQIYGSKAFEDEIKLGINSVFDEMNPAIFNQAIMDFGAMVCKKIPLCGKCPLQEKCLAYANNVEKFRPVKQKKRPKTIRHFYYVIYRDNEKIAISRRSDSDIWRSLYEFPFTELPEKANDNQIIEAVNCKYGSVLSEVRYIDSFPAHILTHQAIFAHLYIAYGKAGTRVEMININDLFSYPVHRLMDKIIRSETLGSIIFPDFSKLL